MSATRLVSIPALVATTVAAAVVTLAAQGTAPLTAGTRIRVRLRPATQPIVGILDTVSSDTVWLRPEGERPASHVALSRLEGIDVSRGQRSKAIEGAGVGAGVGLLGALGGFLASCKAGGFGLLDCRQSGVWWFGSPLAGGAVGYVVGSRFHSPKWEAVPLSSLRVAPVSLNRVGITASLSF